MRERDQQDEGYQIRIDGRNIQCHTPKERRLFYQALAIARNPSDAKHFSLGHLLVIKDACQFHALGWMQRTIKIAIDSQDPSDAG